MSSSIDGSPLIAESSESIFFDLCSICGTALFVGTQGLLCTVLFVGTQLDSTVRNSLMKLSRAHLSSLTSVTHTAIVFALVTKIMMLHSKGDWEVGSL